MEIKKPRRPAIIEPETLEYLEGEEDPALSSESAHTSARILIRANRGEWSDPDPETKARLLGYIEAQGIDELAELWANSPADTLPGTLWRLHLIHGWVTDFATGVDLRFRQGLNSPQLSKYLDVAGAHTLDFLAWKRDLGDIFAGDFNAEFADFLDESSAVLRVLAASESTWLKPGQSKRLEHQVTTRDNALLNTADELQQAATLYRESRLD